MSSFVDEIIHLKNAGTWSGGGTPSKANPDFWDDGDIPWVSPKDMKTFELHSSQDKITAKAVEESPAKLIPEGSVLMVVRSGILSHTFPIAVAKIPVTLNQDMKALTPKKGICSDFLAYQLRALSPLILKTCTKSGTTVASVETKQLQAMPIWVPAEDKQVKIISYLDTQLSRLDETVTILQGIQSKLKQARASILKAAVEGRLVESEAIPSKKEHRAFQSASERLIDIHRMRKTGRRGLAGNVMPLQKDIPVNGSEETQPTGWQHASLSQLVDNIQAGKSFAALNKPPGINETGIAKISAVTWGNYNENESKTVTNVAMINEDYMIQEGDLLMSRANTVELVGAVVIAKKVDKRVMLSDKVLRLHVQSEIKEWLLWVLRSPYGRKQIESLCTGNQDSMRNIGQDRIRSIRIPLPPLQEQLRICNEINRRFSVLDQVESIVEASLARCALLRQAILKQAFEGRLVPPPPEPHGP